MIEFFWSVTFFRVSVDGSSYTFDDFISTSLHNAATTAPMTTTTTTTTATTTETKHNNNIDTMTIKTV